MFGLPLWTICSIAIDGIDGIEWNGTELFTYILSPKNEREREREREREEKI